MFYQQSQKLEQLVQALFLNIVYTELFYVTTKYYVYVIFN